VTETTLNACRSLYSWLREADFRGHDPHDLLESPLIPKLMKRSPFVRLALLQAGRRSPIDLHKWLRVPKRFNPKGGGIILQGLLRGKENVSQNWERDVAQIAQRLLAASVKTKHGIGWGYPFDWQSRTHFVTKKTPTIVTTAFVAEALLKYYQHQPSDELLLALTRAADYMMKDVSHHRTADGLSFGYSEGDKQVVFNASLLGAAYLGKLGAMLGEDLYVNAARDAARFVVKHQAANGSWAYGLASSQQWVDSFHTGYVLLSLREIGEALLSLEFTPAVEKGYAYYRSVFFRNDGLPRYFANKDHPIDTHAAAHAIITLHAFGDKTAALQIAKWMCSNMQNADGSFMYQKHERYTNKIAYIRWSNAWMFIALASLLEEERHT
jgi:hypothetical protein